MSGPALGQQATAPRTLYNRSVALQTSAPRFHRHWFADLKARALARWVSAAADHQLRRVMSSRLRGPLLWQIFRTIGQRAEPDRRLDAVVEFRIRGGAGGGVDRYQLMFAEGRCSASRRRGKAALTLELEPEAFLLLVAGLISPQRLWIAGRLRLRGDMMLALALPRALNHRPAMRSGESLRGASLRDAHGRFAARISRFVSGCGGSLRDSLLRFAERISRFP